MRLAPCASAIPIAVRSACLGVFLAALAGGARADEAAGSSWGYLSGPGLSGDWGGVRSRLEERGLFFEVAYTGDYVNNTLGGIEQGGVYLGNLDMTFTLHTWRLSRWDLGTFFLYGLVNHGGRPSERVGDAQVTDNIEAPSAAKLFEVWWQRAFFDERASFLVGLYDVNSEFYVVESAELFMNSSFGIGPELALSGRNGPSIFPNTALAVRLKVEPRPGYAFTAAVMDGDPGAAAGTHIHLNAADGVFFIAQVSRSWSRRGQEGADESLAPTLRRRVGRTIDQSPEYLKLTLGTWLYSQEQIDFAPSIVSRQPVLKTGHPGLYLLAEFDATALSRLDARGLSTFLQLGWSDGDVGPLVGYTGAGVVYTGLIPFRPIDTLGLAAAIAYNGSGFDVVSRVEGERPAFGEATLELTYRAYPARWFSVQADLQYVIHPGGLESRPDALVAGLRFVVEL